MSDEEMVAYLARCQVEPRCPRPSIETLLHAFVPAPHVAPHPPRRDQRAREHDRRRAARARVLRRLPRCGSPYIRPGFTLSKQVGEAARENPGLELVVLAKHGLVVWGDSAEAAYRRTIEVINRAVAFANERIAATRRASAARLRARHRTRGELLRELGPAVRDALPGRALTFDTSARTVEFVCSADAEQLVTVGAPCPDHLLHTKRVPLWIPYDPDADDAEALRARIPERVERYREEYRAYVEAHGDEARDADPRIVLIQHLGLIAAGTTTSASEIARDLYHRAIEVMAGAQALGGYVSLDAAESFAIEYWPLELYKLAQAPHGRAAGPGGARHRRRRRSAVRSATRWPLRARAWWHSTSTRWAPRRRSSRSATRASRSAAT